MLERLRSIPLDKKTLGIIGFIILLLGLSVALTLVSKTQLFQPKASSQYVQILDTNGQPLTTQNNVPVTTSDSIRLKLNPPDTP